MNFSSNSVIRKPFIGLVFVAFCLSLVQAMSIKLPNHQSQTPITKAFYSDELHAELLALDHELAHLFGKHSEQCPNPEEERETQKTEKDDIQGFLFVKTLQTPNFVETPKAQDNRHYRLLKVDSRPLYVLFHSWKTYLV